jgi:predicted regulator of Ras-like GTPase activity (Roadblock/LC7/MglB family)
VAEPVRPTGLQTPRSETAAAGPRPSRAQEFREILFELVRLDGVRGGLMVTPDGLVITSELPPRFPVEALAALAATLGRQLEVGAERLGRGGFRTALFSSDDGTVFLGGSPVGYLILLGDRNVNLASVRLALRKGVDRLHGTWKTPAAAGAA